MRPPATACVILLSCLVAPARAEGPAPARPRGRPVDALRATCVRAFEEGRHAEAVEACHKAEALGHSPRHLLFEAQALRRLGKDGEARAIFERLAGEKLAPGAPTDAKRVQEAARRELAAANVISAGSVTIVERMQKPASPVDLSRLSNPGLPADPAIPRILACIKQLPAGQPLPAGVLRIALRVAVKGAVEVVEVHGDAIKPDAVAPSPELVACVRARLGELRIARAPRAVPIALEGKYFLRDDQVFGRLREVPR